MIISKVLDSLNLPNSFTITEDTISLYMNKYNEISGKAGNMKRSEKSFAYKMAALNLIKYKRDRKIPITEGFIYVISNPAWKGLYKIGMTIDVQERLAGYQTYSPYRDYSLVHYRFTSNRRETEKSLHNVLKQYKVLGEWFEVPILDAFKALIQNLDR